MTSCPVTLASFSKVPGIPGTVPCSKTFSPAFLIFSLAELVLPIPIKSSPPSGDFTAILLTTNPILCFCAHLSIVFAITLCKAWSSVRYDKNTPTFNSSLTKILDG